MSILTAGQLSLIRKVGTLGMKSPVAIYRQVAVPTGSPAPASNDYGDDGLTDPIGAHTDPIATVNAHIYSRNVATTDETSQSQNATISVVTFRFPVGTDVKVDDILVPTGSPNEYIVTDTNDDDSWPEWLEVNVRVRT